MASDRRSRPTSTTRARGKTVAAYVVAGAVHVVTVGLFAAAFALIVLGFSTVVQPLLGLAVLGLALALRPRPGRLDPDLPVLREADAPALFALAHRVADACGVGRVDAVQLTPESAATVVRYGWGRKRCLRIGLALWAAHTPQQRVAVLAHAMAVLGPHNVRDRAFVGTALDALTGGAAALGARDEAYIAARPYSFTFHAEEAAGGARQFNRRTRTAELALCVPRAALAVTARLLLWLTLPAARRAEGAADAAAARAASTEAAIAVLSEQHLGRVTAMEVHRLAVEARTLIRGRSEPTPDEEFWARVALHAGGLRGRKAGAPDGEPCSATDVWDPLAPEVGRRLGLLAEAPRQDAAVDFAEPDRTRVDDELRSPQREVARRVIRDGVPAPLASVSV